MSDPDTNPVESPRLDAFLRSERWIQARGAAAIRRWAHELFQEAGRGHQAPLPLPEELHPQRVVALWRIARATAQIKGLCAEDESLDEATEVEPDPWTVPFLGSVAPSQAASIRRGRATKVVTLHRLGEGLPLLPPADDLLALDRWCTAAALIARDLGIETTEDGRLGLQGLLDPKQAVMCDVTADQIIALEQLLIDEAQDMLRKHGEPRAVKHLREVHGLSRKEAVGLIRLARADAMTTYSATTEEDRAIMVMELKETISRAKEALDLDTEMKARKLLAMVQGLTRSEPENQAREFFTAVRRVAASQDAKIAKARTVEVLPARTAEPIELVAEPDDPLDAEALAEYDMENEVR